MVVGGAGEDAIGAFPVAAAAVAAAGVDGFWNILCGSNFGFAAAGAALTGAGEVATTAAAAAWAAPAATLPKLLTFSPCPRCAPVVGLTAGEELIAESGLSTVPKLSAGFLAGAAAGVVGILTGLLAAGAAAAAGPGSADFRGCPAWLCRALAGVLVVAESTEASFASLFGFGDCKGEAACEAGWEIVGGPLDQTELANLRA